MDKDARQSIAIHLTHLTAETMAYLSTEGFSISTELGWLFFAGQQPDGPPRVRAVHQSELAGPVLRLLADEGLALVQDSQLLCFVRQAPTDGAAAGEDDRDSADQQVPLSFPQG